MTMAVPVAPACPPSSSLPASSTAKYCMNPTAPLLTEGTTKAALISNIVATRLDRMRMSSPSLSAGRQRGPANSFTPRGERHSGGLLFLLGVRITAALLKKRNVTLASHFESSTRYSVRGLSRYFGRNNRRSAMKRFTLTACAALLAVAMATPSIAADIVAPRPIYKGPAYVAPVFTWSGFYVGVNGGYGFGTTSWTGAGLGTGSFSTNGWLFGGTLGYNIQTGNWVWGIEGDFDWANNKGSHA